MERPIKFRAWDQESQEWCAVSMAWSDHMQGPISTPVVFDGRGRCVIQQYTGLKDKNGVEIYEGDVVEDLTTKTYLGSKKIVSRSGQVKYGNYYATADDPYCSADVTGFYIDGDVFSNNLKDYFDNELEVIGNIYENPELIDGKE